MSTVDQPLKDVVISQRRELEEKMSQRYVERRLGVTPGENDLIQVCWDMQRAATRHREVRSLVQASKSLDCTNLLILTAATAGEETVEWFGTRRTIRLQPLADWAA